MYSHISSLEGLILIISSFSSVALICNGNHLKTINFKVKKTWITHSFVTIHSFVNRTCHYLNGDSIEMSSSVSLLNGNFPLFTTFYLKTLTLTVHLLYIVNLIRNVSAAKILHDWFMYKILLFIC